MRKAPEKTRLCGMTQEEVDSYLTENNISIGVMMEQGFDKDGEYVDAIYDDEGYFKEHGEGAVKIEKSWGFSGPRGFHTFEFQIDDEVKAQYMTVLFYKLMYEYDVAWAHAEALAYSYVTSDLPVPYVPLPPMTEEEQEAVRKRLIDCIDSGNVVIPKAVDETVIVRGEERKASEFDVKEYTDKVEKLYKEGLFTKQGTIEDWKDTK